MPEKQVLGLDCRIFYNSADADGSSPVTTPTWTHLDVVRDATLQLAMTEADATTRAAGGIEIMEPALLQVSVETLLKWLNGSTQCGLLWDRFWSRLPVDLLVLTGEDDDTDALGVRGDFKIFGFPRKEELASVVEIDLKLKPCRSVRDNYVAKAVGIDPEA